MLNLKKLTFFIVLFIAFQSKSQTPTALNGSWVAQSDTAANLLLIQDTVAFSIIEKSKESGCTYHLPLYFTDSTAYINPEILCTDEGSSNHSPFSSRGELKFLNNRQLVWLIEEWNEELQLNFIGKMYFDFEYKKERLVLVRNRDLD